MAVILIIELLSGLCLSKIKIRNQKVEDGKDEDNPDVIFNV